MVRVAHELFLTIRDLGHPCRHPWWDLYFASQGKVPCVSPGMSTWLRLGESEDYSLVSHSLGVSLFLYLFNLFFRRGVHYFGSGMI